MHDQTTSIAQMRDKTIRFVQMYDKTTKWAKTSLKHMEFSYDVPFEIKSKTIQDKITSRSCGKI